MFRILMFSFNNSHAIKLLQLCGQRNLQLYNYKTNSLAQDKLKLVEETYNDKEKSHQSVRKHNRDIPTSLLIKSVSIMTLSLYGRNNISFAHNYGTPIACCFFAKGLEAHITSLAIFLIGIQLITKPRHFHGRTKLRLQRRRRKRTGISVNCDPLEKPHFISGFGRLRISKN